MYERVWTTPLCDDCKHWGKNKKCKAKIRVGDEFIKDCSEFEPKRKSFLRKNV